MGHTAHIKRKQLTAMGTYLTIPLNETLTQGTLTMIETITSVIDAGSLVFGVFGYVWVAMAAFAGLLYIGASR